MLQMLRIYVHHFYFTRFLNCRLTYLLVNILSTYPGALALIFMKLFAIAIKAF